MGTRHKHARLVAPVALVSLSGMTLPMAHGELEERDQLEKIIVTAQKRAQYAQDVGLSFFAFDEDSYRELTRGTLDGLAAQVSNVQAYAANTFLQSVHIRGIGLNEFQGQFDSPVAQHIDEVYISKPWMVSRRHYDMQRVEVLKGPQGTLFGRNATGGAINFYTQEPTREFDAMILLGIDEHARYRAEGMISNALSERLSGRFSFSTEHGSGGPQKNLFTGKDHGQPEVYDLRGQLLWEGERLRVRALAHGGVDRSEKVAWKGPGIFNMDGPALGFPSYCPDVLAGKVSMRPSSCAKFGGFAAEAGFPDAEFEPDGVHTINQNTPPQVDDTFYGGYLRWDYELGFATLTSITAYEYYERIHQEDSQSDIFDSTSTHYYNEINQASQELRLAGSIAPQWRYVLGLYYQRDDLKQVDGSDFSEQPLPLLPPFADQFFGRFDLELESVAVFAHTEYDFSDSVTLNLGLRYTRDTTEVSDGLLGIGLLPQTSKERFVTPCLVTTFPDGPIGAPACPFLGPEAPLFNDKRTDENASWRAGVDWTPVDHVLLFGNLMTGYRSGGYSLPFGGAATEFEPEKLFAQEIGVKSRWLDRTVQVNAAFFRYRYDDVQVNVDDPVSPLVPITRNVGEQRNSGAELEVEWAPNERWFVRQGLGWLDARYRKTGERVITTYAGPISLEGKRPVNSPEWTYNGFVRYRRPVMAGWDGSIGLDYRWIDKRYLEATNQAFDRTDAYWVVNMRAAVASYDGHWEVALYGTNLFDEQYLTYMNNLSFLKLDIFGERRTLGATVSYRFR